MTISLPGILLSDISKDRLLRFAENHHDNYTVHIGKEEGRGEELKMTVITVIEAETGLKFGMMTDEDGEAYAIYKPNVWKDSISYAQFYEIVSPYLKELNADIEPVEIKATEIIY